MNTSKYQSVHNLQNFPKIIDFSKGRNPSQKKFNNLFESKFPDRFISNKSHFASLPNLNNKLSFYFCFPKGNKILTKINGEIDAMKVKFNDLSQRTKNQATFFNSFFSLNNSINQNNHEIKRNDISKKYRYPSNLKDKQKINLRKSIIKERDHIKIFNLSPNMSRVSFKKNINIPSNLKFNSNNELSNKTNVKFIPLSLRNSQIKKSRFDSLMRFSISNFYKSKFPENYGSNLLMHKKLVKFLD